MRGSCSCHHGQEKRRADGTAASQCTVPSGTRVCVWRTWRGAGVLQGESDPHVDMTETPRAFQAPILNKSERGSLKTQPFLARGRASSRPRDAELAAYCGPACAHAAQVEPTWARDRARDRALVCARPVPRFSVGDGLRLSVGRRRTRQRCRLQVRAPSFEVRCARAHAPLGDGARALAAEARRAP